MNLRLFSWWEQQQRSMNIGEVLRELSWNPIPFDRIKSPFLRFMSSQNRGCSISNLDWWTHRWVPSLFFMQPDFKKTSNFTCRFQLYYRPENQCLATEKCLLPCLLLEIDKRWDHHWIRWNVSGLGWTHFTAVWRGSYSCCMFLLVKRVFGYTVFMANVLFGAKVSWATTSQE